MTKPKSRGGRPPIAIDWAQFDKLCELQCTLEEFASWFECSEDTIERAVKAEKGKSFADYFKAKRGKGKTALRRKQFQVALAGDRTMLVWLGKQHLGQADRTQIKHSGSIGTWTDLAAKAGLAGKVNT